MSPVANVCQLGAPPLTLRKNLFVAPASAASLVNTLEAPA